MTEPSPTFFQLSKRFWHGFLSEFRAGLSVAIFCMLLDAFLMLVLVEASQSLINSLLGVQTLWHLTPVIVLIFLASCLRGGVEYAHVYLLSRVSQKVIGVFQEKIFHHILKLDMLFFQKKTSGRLVSLLNYDMNLLRTGLTQSILSFVRDGLTLIFLTGAMFYKDFFLATLTCIIFPLLIWPLTLLGRKVRRLAGTSQAAMADLNSRFQEVFQNIAIVKSYGMEQGEEKRLREHIKRFISLRINTSRTQALLHPLMESTGGIAVVLVVLYGGYQVIAGNRTPGALMAFLLALIAAYKPLKRVGNINNALQEILSALTRLFDVYDAKISIPSNPKALALKLQKGTIDIEGLSFHYPEKPTLFENLTLSIPGQCTVAFVGPSGAGKSTLLNLLLRLYDPQQGTISIDGQDVGAVSLSSLRKNIALVSQEASLFNTTIAENIRFGDPTASFSEVQQAARDAYAEDFIEALPKKYETVIGERGHALSGGQGQRLAIARAFLKNAPILLLDEATSALDTQSEKYIQQALEKLMKNRTTLIVAHRLSTVQSASKIFVMNEGAIVESGTHQTLLEEEGLYKKMVFPQLQQ